MIYEGEKIYYKPKGGCLRLPFAFCVVIIIALLFLSSCATKSRIEYRDRDVNRYITNVVHDTLREKIHDSVYVSVMQKNDTVFVTKYKESIRFKDKIVEKHDTCWRDSIETQYREITKEVTKYPKTYWLFMAISIISVIFVILKLKKWLQIF